MSLRLLITGANGQVGWHLRRALAPLGEVIALTRDQLDLADVEAVAGSMRDFAPDIVVNAAAYTAVDKAESEPELAHKINAVAVGRMAQELAQDGGVLIHYSTDYVFDGNKVEAYTENDTTNPLNIYGHTKLEGERSIAASGCAHVILRTTWVYDIRGKNFLRTVLRLARDREELRMVADQYGAPTWARTIAEATAAIVAQGLHHRGTEWQREKKGLATLSNKTGIYHLTAAGRTSWADFAGAIVKEYEDRGSWPADGGEFGTPLKVKEIIPIMTEQYPTPAPRPRNSVLSNEKVQEVFGVTMPDWRSQLHLAMQDAIRG